MNFLALETSCDETAAAVFTDELVVLSSVVASQNELHVRFGGVVPEIASRAHLRNLLPVIDEALAKANLKLADIGCIAVHNTPGLVGALLMGVTAGKTLAYSLGVPLVAVNHVASHIYACRIAAGRDIFPCVGLVVSGGHTALFRCDSPLSMTLLGTTRDDAAGEAYDKVGKMLGLPYPGGPEIEKAARDGDSKAYDFPRSMVHEPHLDFSFSGLKTAVLYTLQKETGPLPVANLAASFQQAVIEILVKKSLRAAEQTGRRHIALSGGVSLNQALRAAFQEACDRAGYELSVASPAFCTDNAAMIAFAALIRHLAGESSPLDGDIHPNLPLV